jgi:hypothetical protein
MRRVAELGFAILLATVTLAGVAHAFLILGAGSNTSASAPATFIYLPNGSYARVLDGGLGGGPAPCGTLNLAVNIGCNAVSVPVVLQ